MPSEVNFYMEKLKEDMSYPVTLLMIFDSIYDDVGDNILFKIIATDGTIGCESTLSKENMKKVLEYIIRTTEQMIKKSRLNEDIKIDLKN